MTQWTIPIHQLRAYQAKLIADIARDMNDEMPADNTRHIASPAGSEQALRGIPVVGARGVGGTIRGSNPLAALLANERRQDHAA